MAQLTLPQILTRMATDLKSYFSLIGHKHAASDITSGTLPVSRGGTGKTTHALNAVVTGNGTSMMKNVATANGALYATEMSGAARFGTLPIAQGGTGATTAADAAANIVDGQAIAPASVAATGEVSAKAGTTTHKLTEKAEDTRADNLEASIAYVESTTAKTNHAVGDYFMLGDVLMKATAAIATGEQITTSNATPATVQSQIDALRDSVGKVGYEYILTSWHEINAYTFATETLQLALSYDKVPLVIGMTGNNCIVQIMNTTTTSVTVRVYNYNSTTKSCQGVVVVMPSA